MRKIGFENFRKFENFPAMDLAPITIFVGENNAGKSTVVKGILALSDFLKAIKFNDEIYESFHESRKRDRINSNVLLLKNIKFYFNTSYLAHIGTFKRALYNKSNTNTISFITAAFDDELRIEVTGDKNDAECVSGTVSKIVLHNPRFNITIEFNLLEDKAIVRFSPIGSITEGKNIYEGDFDRIYKNSMFLVKYAELVRQEIVFDIRISDNLQYHYDDLIKSLFDSVETSIQGYLASNSNKDKRQLDIFGDEDDWDDWDDEELAPMKPTRKPPMPLSPEVISFLEQFTVLLSEQPENIARRKRWERMGRTMPEVRPFQFPFKPLVGSRSTIEYFYAHAVTQTVIYSAKDTNDYLSRTIHEFASTPKSKHKHEFILKWMKEFEIGTNYEIKSVGGEAHLVTIKNKNGMKVNLADKGMGSIQLMVLLFRLAITLPEKSDRMGKFGYPSQTIIIEEPEQNLHPMLQSKLADLFYELNDMYGFRFIVETHSEYLVRRSQVIVASNYKKELFYNWENPFKVYYFPAEGVPYDMEYATDGYFEKPFGSGFFNVSSELSLDLDRIEQG